MRVRRERVPHAALSNTGKAHHQLAAFDNARAQWLKNRPLIAGRLLAQINPVCLGLLYQLAGIGRVRRIADEIIARRVCRIIAHKLHRMLTASDIEAIEPLQCESLFTHADRARSANIDHALDDEAVAQFFIAHGAIALLVSGEFTVKHCGGLRKECG